jgi:uncharacterized surface protein with fasciclin (FAS1) repeats
MFRFLHKLILACTVTLLVYSCNKLPVVEPIITSPATNTVADVINNTATYSILKAAVTKAGLLPTLSKSGTSYTVFAPDDAAFITSGIPAAAINALDATTLRSILSYHVVPQAIPASGIPTIFPNVQLPTLLSLSPPLVSMSIFPSRRGTQAWVNNIPIVQTDIPVSNGVIHRVAAVVSPPSTLLRQLVNSDTALTFLRAAIARADSGQVGLNRFDSAMNFALANLTVFAPTNNAFRNTLSIPDSSIFSSLPVLTVRGIVAYHLLGSRAFSVNLPTTTTTVPTLLGGAPFPGITFDYSTGALKLKGAANGPSLFNVVSANRNAVNGVLHTIDGVLRPQ